MSGFFQRPANIAKGSDVGTNSAAATSSILHGTAAPNDTNENTLATQAVTSPGGQFYLAVVGNCLLDCAGGGTNTLRFKDDSPATLQSNVVSSGTVQKQHYRALPAPAGNITYTWTVQKSVSGNLVDYYATIDVIPITY